MYQKFHVPKPFVPPCPPPAPFVETTTPCPPPPPTTPCPPPPPTTTTPCPETLPPPPPPPVTTPCPEPEPVPEPCPVPEPEVFVPEPVPEPCEPEVFVEPCVQARASASACVSARAEPCVVEVPPCYS